MANKLVLFGHDLSGNFANAPTNAQPGQMYFAEDTGQWLVYNGTSWQLSSDTNGGGSAGAKNSITKTLTALADNTNGTLATITIPNIIAGGAIRVLVTGIQGDGDSVDSKEYIISVSRVAGANAKALLSSAVGDSATVGATSTATTTVSLSAVSGGVTAVNTFNIQAKVARSAGTSSNHIVVGEVTTLNGSAGGITVA